MPEVRAWAPGRVNLIGDHTDYMGGLVLPMAVQMGTTITATRVGDGVELSSSRVPGMVSFALPIADPSSIDPAWGRYVAGVAAELGSTVGLQGRVDSDLPLGGGLSSSASLEVAFALAMGGVDVDDPVHVAAVCQRAEQRATGVPCGIMDQLASAGGVEGHALLIDCTTLTIETVPVPDDAEFWVLDSGQPRGLVDSEYAIRRVQCEQAESLVGPLPRASASDIESIDDVVLRARARHVRSECARVREFAAAITRGDMSGAGDLMVDSHRSLRDDFGVSTDRLDSMVTELVKKDGVLGARLTGAGFGGCVVALTRPGVELDGWRVSASAGAAVETVG